MRLSRGLLVALPAFFIVAACSTSVSVDQASVEATIASQLAEALQMAPEELTVTCPGDLDGTVGATMDCNVSGPAGDLPVQVKVTKVDGTDVFFDITDAPA